MATHFDYTSVLLKYVSEELVRTTNYSYYANVSMPLPTRSSVDTGRFNPGEYRVNPYSVSNCAIETIYAEQSVKREWTRWYAGKLERYTQETSGYPLSPAWQFGCNLINFPWPSSAVVNSHTQLALQKAKSKVAAADLELGEVIGEYRETIQMLRKPLSSLREFLLDDRSRNLRLLVALARKDKRTVNWLLGRTGRASARTMSSTWLELRYGFRPLVMLVQDVIEHVSKKQQEVWDPSKIRSARSNMVFTDKQASTYNYSISSLRFEGSVEVEDEIKVCAAIQYRQSDRNSFLDNLGLTPRFLPEVAWELTRCSFVVDWIYSIGPWLGSLRIAPSVEVLGNTVGVRHTRYVKPVYNARYYVAGTTGIPVDNVPRIVYNNYDRTTNVDISYLPHFTWGRTLDLYKAIDAVSLLWQFAKIPR